MMESSSDYDSEGSEVKINVSTSKRIGRLMKRGEDDVGEHASPSPGKQVQSFIPDLDNFLDPAVNDELIEPNALIEQQLWAEIPNSPSHEEMEDAVIPTKKTRKPSGKGKKSPREKRAPHSKKEMLEARKIRDTMTRTAPLLLDEAIDEESKPKFNMSSFFQKFQTLGASSENKEEVLDPVVEAEFLDSVAEEVSKNPQSKTKLKEDKIQSIATLLKTAHKKPSTPLTLKINLTKAPSNVEEKKKKALTLTMLNSSLIGKMTQNSLRKKESVPIDAKIKEEILEEIVYSTEDEEGDWEKEQPGPSHSKEADLEESPQTKDGINIFEEIQTLPSEKKPFEDCTLLIGNNSDQTQPLENVATSEPNSYSNPFDSPDSKSIFSSDLLDSTQEMKLLNISRDHPPSPTFMMKTNLENLSLDNSIINTNSPKNTSEDVNLASDSDEEVVIRRVPKRQQLDEIDLEASDDDEETRPISLKRLVKKDLLSEEIQEAQPSPPFRNQFVADQADEEDEAGEVIQYSGSDEDMDDNEYDFDDLEVGSDIGPIDRGALRELHHKFEKDAENKGYNLLTRKRQGANRILGDDDEGHQLARRQRNRFTAQSQYEQEFDYEIEKAPAGELLTADFIPSGINNIRNLASNIPRSSTARRQMSLHSGLSAAQVAQAWNDPDPKMSFLRASSVRSDASKDAPNIPKVNSVVSRAGKQHSLLNRSTSDPTIATFPNTSAQPILKNPFQTFLTGHSTTSLTSADPSVRATHMSQLKRQFDTKAPEGQITKLSRTNARRFGYGNFKIYGKRSEFPDLFPDAQKKS